MSTPGNLRQSQREIWEGCVPVEIRLAGSECKTYDQSEPYLACIWLPLLLKMLTNTY
jgi:autophagy-related protein 5